MRKTGQLKGLFLVSEPSLERGLLLTNIAGFATMKYQIDYAFDPVGNVTNRVITGLQGMSGVITTRYEYDVMNRLTNEVCLTNGFSGGQTNS